MPREHGALCPLVTTKWSRSCTRISSSSPRRRLSSSSVRRLLLTAPTPRRARRRHARLRRLRPPSCRRRGRAPARPGTRSTSRRRAGGPRPTGRTPATPRRTVTSSSCARTSRPRTSRSEGATTQGFGDEVPASFAPLELALAPPSAPGPAPARRGEGADGVALGASSSYSGGGPFGRTCFPPQPHAPQTTRAIAPNPARHRSRTARPARIRSRPYHTVSPPLGRSALDSKARALHLSRPRGTLPTGKPGAYAPDPQVHTLPSANPRPGAPRASPSSEGGRVAGRGGGRRPNRKDRAK